ncbi:MAG: EAL domain-containing protein [Betaproteobacteria bacterium]|nr:EAL domain-containing protein [Betaproteobacteria bacterium]
MQASRWIYATLGIALTGAVLHLSGLAACLEYLLSDVFLATAERAPDPSIVIVEIDNASLERIGRWPWSRAIHAEFVDLAQRAGAKSVGFDIAFAEPDAADLNGDAIFAATLARSDRVVLPVFVKRDETGIPWESRPLPRLAVAARLGRVDVPIDRDGLVRRTIEDHRNPALRATTFANAAWEASKEPASPGDPAHPAKERPHYEERLIPFCSFNGRFSRLSFADVIADPGQAAFLRERIVLVGVTAPRLASGLLVPGKGSPRMLSGIEVQAHVLNAIKQGSLVRAAGWVLDATAAVLALVVMVDVMVFMRAPRWVNATVAATLVVCGLVPALLLLKNIWLSPALPILILTTGYATWWWLYPRTTERLIQPFRSHPDVTRQSSEDAFVMHNEDGLHVEQDDGHGKSNLDLQMDLAHAIERNELLLHYQPQIDVTGGRVVGVEALIRWQHPRLGLLGPDRIIPVAEAADLIIATDDWVAHTAAHQLAAWRKSDFPLLTMSINVSNRQLLRTDLVTLAKHIIDESDTGRGELIFEVTERMLIHDPDQCAKTIAAIRGIGIGVSIDDFGTGYSSLAHLQNLTVDQIKIDQSFIQLLPDDHGGAATVQAVLNMARTLGIPTVAEGVETRAQLEWLRAQHCEKVQGYLYSRPVAASELPDLINAIQNRMTLAQAIAEK